MEFWKNCWNCGHDTLQARVALEFFPHVVEMFSKEENGKVNQRVWTVFYDSYTFAKCKNIRLRHFLLTNIGLRQPHLKRQSVLLER